MPKVSSSRKSLIKSWIGEDEKIFTMHQDNNIYCYVCDKMMDWLKETLETKYRAKILSSSYEPAADKGESYGSNTRSITFTLESSNGNQFEKRVIFKTMPESEVSKKVLEDYGCFNLEINMYSTVLPRMKIYFDGNPDSCPWCDCISHNLRDAIVLEDLKQSGFRVCSRIKGLNLAHTKEALKGLGVFHGLSKKLSKNDHPFPKMNLVQDKHEPQFFLQGAFEVCANAVETWGAQWIDVAKKLRKEKNLAFNKLKLLAGFVDEKLEVLNHGDCWTCNIMFLYQENEIPTAVKFIDFQTSHWNSFGWDLHGILACSTQPDVRRNNWELLIKTYSSSLAKTMKKCGIDDNSIPKFEEVLRELERLKYHRFVCLVGMYPICCGASGGYDPEKNVAGNNSPPQNAIIYGESYKINVQEDLWSFYKDGTF